MASKETMLPVLLRIAQMMDAQDYDRMDGLVADVGLDLE